MAKRFLEIPNTLAIGIVGDEVGRYSAVTAALKQMGYKNIINFKQASAALEYSESHKIELFFVDRSAADMSGWQFVKSLKMAADLPAVQVIMVGSPVGVDAGSLLEFGVQFCLEIPLVKRDMAQAMTAVLSEVRAGGGLEAKFSMAKQQLLEDPRQAVSSYSSLKQASGGGGLRSSVGLAQSHGALNELDAAAKALEGVKDQLDFDFQATQLKLHLQHQRIAEADRKIEEILTSCERQGFAFVGLMKITYAYQKYQLTSHLGSQAIEDGQSSDGIILWQAKALQKMGHHLEALQVLDRHSKSQSTLLGVLEVRGRCYMKLERFSEACVTYAAAIKSDPRNHQIYYNAALASLADQRLEAAVELLQLALKLSPSFFVARRKLKELQKLVG